MNEPDKILMNDGKELPVSKLSADEVASLGRYGRFAFTADGFACRVDPQGCVILPKEYFEEPKAMSVSPVKFLRSKWGASIGALLLTFAGATANYARYSSDVPEATPDYDADAVVVVTGGSGRVKTAFLECKEGDRLFISGANSSVSAIFSRCGLRSDEVEIDMNDVELGTNAKNTAGNAMEIADWLLRNPDIRKITLVTSAYHKGRTMVECQKYLPDDVEVRVRTVGDYTSTGSKIQATIGEIMKFNTRFFGLAGGDAQDNLYRPDDVRTLDND